MEKIFRREFVSCNFLKNKYSELLRPLCIHAQHMLCVNAQDPVYLPFVFTLLLRQPRDFGQQCSYITPAIRGRALFKLPRFPELQTGFPPRIIRRLLPSLHCAIPSSRHGVPKHANICIWGSVWQVLFVLMKRDTICMERSCLIISALISEQWKHGLKWNLQLSSDCVQAAKAAADSTRWRQVIWALLDATGLILTLLRLLHWPSSIR